MEYSPFLDFLAKALIAIIVGSFLVISGLDLPSIKYLRKKGLKSIQWKKLFKEADFRNKYMVILGLGMYFFAFTYIIMAFVRTFF